MITKKFTKLTWWEVGLLSLAASFVGGLSSLMSHKNETKLYTKTLIQAPWAPPAWLFAPAWTINNFFVLLALQKLLKKKSGKNKPLLALQGGIWVIFFSFNYVYFNKKTVVLAAVWTVTDATFATTSLALAAKEDKQTALYYLPLTVWTNFASTVAVYQALKNDDVLLNTKALLN